MSLLREFTQRLYEASNEDAVAKNYGTFNLLYEKSHDVGFVYISSITNQYSKNYSRLLVGLFNAYRGNDDPVILHEVMSLIGCSSEEHCTALVRSYLDHMGKESIGDLLPIEEIFLQTNIRMHILAMNLLDFWERHPLED